MELHFVHLCIHVVWSNGTPSRLIQEQEKYNCVCSAGVLGTAEILFQSKRRGLNLSDRLGLGLSCNGNNVACVAGSQAPLHGYGLTKKQFLGIPFQNRPGPAISSSFTSSLGFTIQVEDLQLATEIFVSIHKVVCLLLHLWCWPSRKQSTAPFMTTNFTGHCLTFRIKLSITQYWW